MIRVMGLSGLFGLLVLSAGFAIVGYVDPILAGGIALIVIGLGLILHAAVRAIATKFGMGDMI